MIIFGELIMWIMWDFFIYIILLFLHAPIVIMYCIVSLIVVESSMIVFRDIIILYLILLFLHTPVHVTCCTIIIFFQKFFTNTIP